MCETPTMSTSVRAADATPGPSSGATVLIVDDELSIAEIIAEVLDEEGYVTLLASGGDQAMEILATRRPDLILLDLYMPGMSGLDLLRHLRSADGTETLPVVVMTAGTVDTAALGRQGATRVLPKPFEVDALIATVRSLA
jgi:two-component system nitrogen regulation response regulator NtrX